MEVRGGRGPLRFTTEIYPNDVLFGRGSPSYHNEGNIRLRDLVKARGSEYAATNKHDEKTKIAAQVVQIVLQRQGRFLRKIETQQELAQLGVPEDAEVAYVIVDDTTIFKKVKQLLREQKLFNAQGLHSKLKERSETASQVASEANQGLETSKNSSETSNKDEEKKRSRDEVQHTIQEREPSPKHQKVYPKSGPNRKSCDYLTDNARRTAVDHHDPEQGETREILIGSHLEHLKQYQSDKHQNSSNGGNAFSHQDEMAFATKQIHHNSNENQNEIGLSPKQFLLTDLQSQLFSAQHGLQLPGRYLPNTQSRSCTIEQVNANQIGTNSEHVTIPVALGQLQPSPNNRPLRFIDLNPPQIQGFTQNTFLQQNQILPPRNQQQENGNALLVPAASNSLRSAEVQHLTSSSHIQSSENSDFDESYSES